MLERVFLLSRAWACCRAPRRGRIESERPGGGRRLRSALNVLGTKSSQKSKIDFGIIDFGEIDFISIIFDVLF